MTYQTLTSREKDILKQEIEVTKKTLIEKREKLKALADDIKWHENDLRKMQRELGC